MAVLHLDKNNEFIVKEWKAVNYMVGIFLLSLVILIICLVGVNSISSILWIFLTASPFFLFALIHRKKAASDTAIIRVNDAGLYYYEKLVTDWRNFSNAYVTDERKTERFGDNFQLVVEFYSGDLLIKKKIPLTNTQNKSEEEVYAALMYFHRQFINADVETIDVNYYEQKNLVR